MARPNVVYGVAFAALCGVAALVLPLVLTTSSSSPFSSLPFSSSLYASVPLAASAAATGSAQPVQFDRIHLYSAEPDPVTGEVKNDLDRAVDKVVDGLARFRYATKIDRSTDDIVLKSDGEHYASSQSYYPEQPNEIGRRPHVAKTWAPNVDLVTEETSLRVDGTLESHTLTGEDGTQHVVGYGRDGVTVILDRQFGARKYPHSDPIFQIEQRWREDAAHSLEYSNVLNADGSRTITDWDDQLRPLKVTQIPPFNTVMGTTVVAYYPDTRTIRLEASADANVNTAKYYRRDGTIDHILAISPFLTNVQYYDATGKKMTLEQLWWREHQDAQGKRVKGYRIYVINEMDDQGNKSRTVDYFAVQGDIPSNDILYNVDSGGVRYVEINRDYSQETGTLTSVRYFQHEAVFPPTKEELHTPAENIRPDIPAGDFKIMVNLEEDDLAIPPPQTGDH